MIWQQSDIELARPMRAEKSTTAGVGPVASSPRRPEVEEAAGLVRLDSHPENAATETSPKLATGRVQAEGVTAGETAPIDDAEIYQMDGKFPLVRWLCAVHVRAWKDRGWTAKPGAEDGAGKPPWCSDCELARQAR